MSDEYRALWENLGINMRRHDLLMNALPPIFEKVYLGQSSRVAAMVRRVGVEERFVFAGGVAHNACLRSLLEQELEMRLTVPSEPQTVGGLGAALYAAQQWEQTNQPEEA